MKIRAGFVSNSSSSSYVVIYRHILDDEPLNSKINYIAFGDQFDGGIDFIAISSEMLDLLNKADNRSIAVNDNGLILGELIMMTSGGTELTNEELNVMLKCKDSGGHIIIFGDLIDHNCTDNVADFEYRYINGEENGIYN